MSIALFADSPYQPTQFQVLLDGEPIGQCRVRCSCTGMAHLLSPSRSGVPYCRFGATYWPVDGNRKVSAAAVAISPPVPWSR